MNREQHLKLIEHVQAVHELASAPLSRGTRERPFRLTLVFLDGTVQELHFESGWEAELGLTVLVEVFPDHRPVIDLLKSYFQIEDRDGPRRIREKLTGKLLTLDEALRPPLIPL